MWSIGASVLTAAIVLSMLPGTLAGGAAEARLVEFVPGVPIALRADAAGMIFAALASCL